MGQQIDFNEEHNMQMMNSNKGTFRNLKSDSEAQEKTFTEKYCGHKLIFKHNSKNRIRWDLFIIILALYNCIMIPMNVSFSNMGFTDTIYSIIFDRILDFIFFLDVLLAFRTTFINQKTGLIVTEPKKIAFHYVFQDKFVVDLLASIPFDLFLSGVASGNKTTFRMIGLLKLIRLLRLGRLIRFMQLNDSSTLNENENTDQKKNNKRFQNYRLKIMRLTRRFLILINE